MDPKHLVKEYLSHNIVLQLATVADGKPQLCTVHFAFDDKSNLYWFSSRTSNHSAALSTCPDAAIGVLHSVESRQCVHMNGTASRASGADLEAAHALYSQRFGENEERLSKSLSEEVPDAGAYYVFKPTGIVLFDGENFPDEPRQEVAVA